eukprot:8981967-Pyramimonas_sp.AAC.1
MDANIACIQPQTASSDGRVEVDVELVVSPLVQGSKLMIKRLQARLIPEARVAEALGVLARRGPALRVSLS